MNIKKTIITGAAVASLLAATVFPAFAANDKVTMFDKPTGGCSVGATGGIDEGFANLNEVGSMINGVVSLKGANPNATYTVTLVDQSCSVIATIGMITTNGQGNGNVAIDKVPAPTSGMWLVEASNPITKDFLASPLAQ